MHLGPALDQYVLGPKPVRAMRLIQAKRENGREGREEGELRDVRPEYRIWNLESRPEFQNDKDSCAPAPGVTFEMHLCV